MAFKFGFQFSVGGSVPITFISLGEMDLGDLQARQNLLSDFSYGGVDCKLTATTNFRANSCK
jgi:hypothetical protein